MVRSGCDCLPRPSQVALQDKFEAMLSSTLGQMKALFEAEPAMQSSVVSVYIQLNDVIAEMQRRMKEITSDKKHVRNQADQEFLTWGTTSLKAITQSMTVWARDTDVGRACTTRVRELQPTLQMVLTEGAGYVSQLQSQSSALYHQVSQGAESLWNGVGSQAKHAEAQLGQTVESMTDWLGDVYRKAPEMSSVLSGVAEQAAQVLNVAGEAASDKQWEIGLWMNKLTEDLSFTAWAYKQGQRVGAVKDPVVAEYQRARRQTRKAWQRRDPMWQRVLTVAGIFAGFGLFVIRGFFYWVGGWCLSGLHRARNALKARIAPTPPEPEKKSIVKRITRGLNAKSAEVEAAAAKEQPKPATGPTLATTMANISRMLNLAPDDKTRKASSAKKQPKKKQESKGTNAPRVAWPPGLSRPSSA